MAALSVFVGSSTEAEPYAQLVVELVTAAGFECRPWWSEFPVGVSFLQALVDVCNRARAAIFIAAPDDQTEIRGVQRFVARQNVLLEYGIFAGVHGSRRVAVLRLGDVTLPTDLAGITQLHCRLPSVQEDLNHYRESVIAPKLRPWLRSMQEDHEPYRELIAVARELQETELLQLLAQARWLKSQRLTVECYPDSDILDIVKRCAVAQPAVVGLEGTKTDLPHHIRLRLLDPEGTDVRKLACNMIHRIKKTTTDLQLRPLRIAVPSTEFVAVGQTVADLMGFPAVIVEPKAQGITGVTRRGEEVVIVHDVIVSGETPARCAGVLRNHGVTVKHVFPVLHYRHPERDPGHVMHLNDLVMHPLCTVDEQWFPR